MFYSSAVLANLAKQLAMTANSRVPEISRAVTGSVYPPEITGAVLGFMPHLFEKAIVTSPLPGDVSARLVSMFLSEYEELMKITCNAGGFSNPIKKVLFNASFSTMFKREYNDLKPKIDRIWQMAREKQQNPIDLVAFGLLKYCENSTETPWESEAAIDRLGVELNKLFHDVHTAKKA